jgi:hypothetical protein
MSESAPEYPISYVVLDPALRKANSARFEALVDGFVTGYLKFFKGDEAEPTAQWRARIDGKPQPQPVMRIAVAVEHKPAGEVVVGGLTCEYYRRSHCVLATYLYVSDVGPYRGRGHARKLLAAARVACEALGEVRATIAEAEWPEALKAARFGVAEIANARSRLRFFARLGARMLNLDYVQPILGPGKRPVSHLRLFLLPPALDAPRPSDDAVAGAVGALLAEFYDALAEENGSVSDQETLVRLQDQLATRRPLMLAVPRLCLDDIAVCLHYVEPLTDAPSTQDLLQEVAKRQCPVLHSMETDLLSHAYRQHRVFRTMCLTKPVPPARSDSDSAIAVEIEFPNRIVFHSENRREERHWPLRRRPVRAYLSASFFFDARLIVWNLTLRVGPAVEAGAWLDEIDVITLLKLSDDAADQEFVRVPGEESGAGERLADAIRFRLLTGDQTPLDATKLLGAVAAVTHQRLQGDAPIPTSAAALRAATVEVLDRRDIRATKPFLGIDDHLDREALCGIATGILDFDEIDDAEARDMLTPSVALEDGLLRVHRSLVVYIANDDRAARTVAGTVGISPYLIIPHATVLCDDSVLEPFDARPLPGSDPSSIRGLSDALVASRPRSAPSGFPTRLPTGRSRRCTIVRPKKVAS